MRYMTVLLFAMLAIAFADNARAQAAYPAKPIHLMVGFPPGSQPDIVARLLADHMTSTLGKPVVVENVPGAAGNIAADRIAKAAPDGYTFGLLSQTHLAVNPSLYKLPYDPIRDFAPISQIVVSPDLLVVPEGLPARSVGELIEMASTHPGKLTFASSGSGTGTHIAAELFKSTVAVDIRHVPYKGVVAAIPDLVSGRVTMMFSPIPVVLPLVREGKLRALAVTSLTRSTAVPDVPTVAEAGYPGFEATNWYGLVAPAKTSAAIVDKLHDATIKALEVPALRAKLVDLGLEIIGNSPVEFANAIRLEIPKWAKLISQSAIKVD